MMAELRIVVDAGSLRKAKSGATTGPIHIDVDGVSFPQFQWHDFPVVVLTDWIDLFVELTQSEKKKERLGFMDGPFLALVEKRDEEWLGVQLIRERVDNPIWSGNVLTKEFACSLGEAAVELLSAFTHGTEDRDAKALREAYFRLTELL